jgi:hypothetical protein
LQDLGAKELVLVCKNNTDKPVINKKWRFIVQRGCHVGPMSQQRPQHFKCGRISKKKKQVSRK